MKTKFKFIVLLGFLTMSVKAQKAVSPCLAASGVNADCPVLFGDPYIEGSCIAGIQRQIARSINAENIVAWNDGDNIPCWVNIQGPQPLNNSQSPNCNPPYDLCYGNYCPNKYCATIKSFVDLKASFIVRAVNPWANAQSMQTSGPRYDAMKQFIVDINAAYDCGSVRRPVVQGGIFENCDKGVESITIPTEVIDAFRNDKDFNNSSKYYLDANGLARTDLNFTLDRIIHGGQGVNYWWECPDITKIEARMWFYHCAKIYIDLGYKSIHLGQMKGWALNDITFSYTTFILNIIREYASNNKTFILLVEENYKGIKFPGTETFMFDFDIRALRNREVADVTGDYCPGCTPTPLTNYLVGTPCESEPFKAVINDCAMNLSNNIGGYSPLNGCYMPSMPYNTYFDFGPGALYDVITKKIINNPSSGPSCTTVENTWGYDDARWFSEIIPSKTNSSTASQSSSPCRKFWIGDAICRLRDFHNGFGFMIAPGLLTFNKPENVGQIYPSPAAYGSYLLIDEPDVENEVKTKWIPNDDIQIRATKTCTDELLGYCSEPDDPKKKSCPRYRAEYILNVINPDCSTVYTWHIQDEQNGRWLPFQYGKECVLRAPLGGGDVKYTVYLRQDNLGNFNGSHVKTDQFTISLEESCCRRNCHYYLKSSNSDENEVKVEHNNKSTDLEAYENYIKNKKYRYEIKSNKTELLGASKDINIDSFIKISPNPTNDFLNIQFNIKLETKTNIVVLNTMGQIMDDINLSDVDNYQLNVSNYASGTYFIKVINNASDYSTTLKFIKASN